MSVDTTTHESSSRTDPTKLTTDQLNREIETLKALLTVNIDNLHEDIVALFNQQKAVPDRIVQEVNHLRELTEARLAEAAVATKLLQASTDRTPAQVDEKIKALADVHNEKFSSIQNQFRERDVRADQTSKQDKVAIDAALQAQKEAVGEQNKSSALAIAKSEASTDKRIDQLGGLILSTAKNVDDKFSDMKDRVALIEGRGTGAKDSWGYLVGFVGIIAALVAVFMAMHR
jgi:DNA anti-recombination protein RmuC